ncbi:hypothetical protein ACFOY2_06495 [Nonomuraea purpurea]|uniref:Uncharacterized protein n=1 Tax=Nonomuraea purpurea TaxID=1849276 RepID=A0ABV8FYP5_9ACTN
MNTLDAHRRPAGLLAVTEDHLQAYKDDALNGRLRHGVREPGAPLAANTPDLELGGHVAYQLEADFTAETSSEPGDAPT